MKYVALILCLSISALSFGECLQSENEVIKQMEERLDHIDRYNAIKIGEKGIECFANSEKIRIKVANLYLKEATLTSGEEDRIQILEKARELVELLVGQENLLKRIDSAIERANGLDSRNAKIRAAYLRDYSRNIKRRRKSGWKIYTTRDGYAIWSKPYIVSRKGINGMLFWYRFADPRYDFMLNSACPRGSKRWVLVPKYNPNGTRVRKLSRRNRRRNSNIIGWYRQCGHPHRHHHHYWWPRAVYY